MPASPPASRPAAPPRTWTPISSCLSCHTRHHVPRRSWSHGRQAAPPCRRARRSPPTADRSCPRHQPAANGRPARARTWPPATPLFPRFLALALGPLRRDSARMVLAPRRDGATVVKTRTPPAHNRVVSWGGRPVCRRWGRRRWRALVACSADRRDAWPGPRTAPRLGAWPRTALRRRGSQGCSRTPCLRATRCPSPADPGRWAGLLRRRTSAGCRTGSTRGGRGIPPVCPRDLPRPHRQGDATFAGMLLRDGTGDTLPRDHVQTEVAAILSS
jgi:hypothetical protein